MAPTVRRRVCDGSGSNSADMPRQRESRSGGGGGQTCSARRVSRAPCACYTRVAGRAASARSSDVHAHARLPFGYRRTNNDIALRTVDALLLQLSTWPSGQRLDQRHVPDRACVVRTHTQGKVH